MSVSDIPAEAHKACAFLEGQNITADTIRAAAEMAAAEDIDPGGDIHATAEFRRHLAKVLAQRALEKAYQRALGDNSRSQS
jgi:CO/xanthine dehydrogenase FAD-binding subunit